MNKWGLRRKVWTKVGGGSEVKIEEERWQREVVEEGDGGEQVRTTAAGASALSLEKLALWQCYHSSRMLTAAATLRQQPQSSASLGRRR